MRKYHATPTRDAPTCDAAARDYERFKTASQASAEQWARRAMWLLVVVTSLWDIGVTFDKSLGLTARLLSASIH